MFSQLQIDMSPSWVQLSKNTKEFKNALVRRKLTEYQTKLEDSVRHKYYGKYWLHMTEDESTEWKEANVSLCPEYR